MHHSSHKPTDNAATFHDAHDLGLIVLFYCLFSITVQSSAGFWIHWNYVNLHTELCKLTHCKIELLPLPAIHRSDACSVRNLGCPLARDTQNMRQTA